MQKKIWTIAVTLPLVVALGIATMAYTQFVSQAYEQEVQGMVGAYGLGDYAAAERILREMETEWEKREPLLQMWVPHSDTQLVRSSLQSARIGLVLRDDTLLLEQAAALQEALRLLRLQDDVNWHNIL